MLRNITGESLRHVSRNIFRHISRKILRHVLRHILRHMGHMGHMGQHRQCHIIINHMPTAIFSCNWWLRNPKQNKQKHVYSYISVEWLHLRGFWSSEADGKSPCCEIANGFVINVLFLNSGHPAASQHPTYPLVNGSHVVNILLIMVNMMVIICYYMVNDG